MFSKRRPESEQLNGTGGLKIGLYQIGLWGPT